MIILGIISYFSLKNRCCGYSLEAPRRGAFNESHNIYFLWRTGENYPRQNYHQVLVLKFCEYFGENN